MHDFGELQAPFQNSRNGAIDNQLVEPKDSIVPVSKAKVSKNDVSELSEIVDEASALDFRTGPDLE